MSFFSPQLRIPSVPNSPKAWLGSFGICEGPGALVFGVLLDPPVRSSFGFLAPKRVNF